MAKKIGDRHYLEPGDKVELDSAIAKFTEDEDGHWHYNVIDISVAQDPRAIVEGDDEKYFVEYAWDLPEDDSYYGRPYYIK